ncbi:MAG: arginine--tRNA ligase, partial [Candidatus Margulisiibacteriota bacterium]
MAKTKISSILGSVLAALGIQADLEFRVDIPPRQELGDYASNIAIIYGRKLKQNPLKLAEQISKKVTELDKEKLVSKVEFVKPGFVNIFLNNSFLQQTTQDILQLDHAWGTSQAGNQERVLLEFVS